MSQDGKGDTSTLSIVLFVGAIGIGIWFLTVASDFVDSGTSPAYAVFFFVPICGVFLGVIVLADVVKSLSSSTKNNTELSGEDATSSTDGDKEDNSTKRHLKISLALIGGGWLLGQPWARESKIQSVATVGVMLFLLGLIWFMFWLVADAANSPAKRKKKILAAKKSQLNGKEEP
jgi:hypothetical protein